MINENALFAKINISQKILFNIRLSTAYLFLKFKTTINGCNYYNTSKYSSAKMIKIAVSYTSIKSAVRTVAAAQFTSNSLILVP